MEGQKPVYADEIESLGLSGIACTIHADGESIRVTVPIPGWHMVLNALAATAVGRALGLTMQEIKPASRHWSRLAEDSISLTMEISRSSMTATMQIQFP